MKIQNRYENILPLDSAAYKKDSFRDYISHIHKINNIIIDFKKNNNKFL